MGVGGSVEKENVLTLKLKPCAPKAYHEGQGEIGSVEVGNVLGLKLKPCAPKAYHEGQCEGERECGGRKCPRTQTQTHTGLSHSVSNSRWFYLNVAGPRTCAPKAYHSAFGGPQFKVWSEI